MSHKCAARAGQATTHRSLLRSARLTLWSVSVSLNSSRVWTRRCEASASSRRFSITASSYSPTSSPTTRTIHPSATIRPPTATPPPTDYVGLLHYLHALNRNRGVRLGLSNMKALLSSLPAHLYTPDTHPIIHVAGSNGKGSVATKLAAALTAHRLTTALYTSPHLSTWRERLTIDGECISEDEVCQLLPAILDTAAAHQLPLTAFEAQTALALCWFRVRRVDVAVVECGLGGRLDATNAIEHSLLAVLTSISLEHTALLGPTTRHITREKAGVIKAGQAAVVIGPTVDEAVVREVASEVNGAGEVVRLSGQFTSTEAENVAVATAALAVIQASSGELSVKVKERMGGWDAAAIEQAMSARPPCRYERLTLPTTPPLSAILDVGHNPAAFARLVSAVRSDYPTHRIRAVVGMSADKDIAACMAALLPHVEAVHFATAASPRSASLEQMNEAVAGAEHRAKVVVEGSGDVTDRVQAAVRQCCEWNSRRAASEPEELLLVCGSFSIFRDVRPALGLPCTTDLIDLNESSLTPKGGEQSEVIAAAALNSAATTMQPIAAPTSSLPRHKAYQRLSTSQLPSATTLSIQQPVRFNATTSSSSTTLSPTAALTAPTERHRTTKDLTLSPAGSDYHRSCVQSLYRHMLTLARHFSSPLTVTPVADIRKEFRGAKECGLEEARERLRVGRGQLAYLRTQVGRSHWRTGDVVGEKTEVRRDHLSDAALLREASEQQLQVVATAEHKAEFKKGYERIFAVTEAEEQRSNRPSSDSDVQRWVYDEAGEAVVELSEEGRQKLVEQDGTVGGRRVSNSQGLTDEQYKRDRAIKERYSFRGPRWKHIR